MKNFLKKIKKFLKTPGLFSRALVVFCIAYSVRVIEWQMDIFESTQAEASELVACAIGLFGGELLLLCLKRIFSKGRTSEEDEEDFE